MIRYSYYRTRPWLTSPIHFKNSLIQLQCGFSSLLQPAQLPEPPTYSDFDAHVFADMLKKCITNSDPTAGKALHCDVLKRGSGLDLFAWNILLNFYVKSEFLDDACKLFDELSERNTITFVTLIHGFSQSHRFLDAIDFFVRLHREGHELNPFVFTTILKLLVNMVRGELARNIHGSIVKLGHDGNAFVGTALIDAYSFCGFIDGAREVFNGIAYKDMVSWTGMVTCYAENGYFDEALKLFSQMRMDGFSANNFSLASVFKACIGLEAIGVGKSVHSCTLKARYEIDPYVSVALLDLYTKSGDIMDARQVFEEIPKKDVIPWSFMIARYSQSDLCQEAVELFSRMRQALVIPNQFTFASVLQACATLNSLCFGRQIHCLVLKVGLDMNVYVSNALTDVYAKCGQLDCSVELFCELPNRNEVTWNTMIVGYVQFGEGEKALTLFLDMLGDQVQLTEVTYSSVLRACASLTALELGIQIHSLTIKTSYAEDIVVVNALIDMYAKCGSIKNARIIFDEMSKRDVVSWNAMVCAYSMHGLGREALKIFEKMQKTDVKPNHLTFVGVLSACSNTGSLDQGQAYFISMLQDYSIEPCIEHYTCMVSLLGRLGHLDKAQKLIEEIPFEPSVMVWRALLAACVTHNNPELGRVSANHIIEMEPQDESAYVLLSNIYASAKKWDDVASIRKKMKRKGVKKEPGLSWIEYQGNVHYFTVGDTSHPDIRLIYGMLEWMHLRSKKAGYVPNRNVILLDVEEDEKTCLLWVHSERLALAFGLIRTPSGSPIRIIKNLRICMDCHAMIKFISKVVQREIVIRDINRFHHFEDGICSCGDYW